VTLPPTEPLPPREQPRPKPTRGQRAAAFTFLGAFGLTMLTVILTGLNVRSPSARQAPETPAVTLLPNEPRTIHLVFMARTPLTGVELTVDLPSGIELETHPGQRRVVLETELASGNNALPLRLVARDGRGGQLAARLRHRDEQKTFVVDLTIASP
jgi:hypothetical protein